MSDSDDQGKIADDGTPSESCSPLRKWVAPQLSNLSSSDAKSGGTHILESEGGGFLTSV